MVIQNSYSNKLEQGLGLCCPPTQEAFNSQSRYTQLICYIEDLGLVTKTARVQNGT